MPTKQTAACGEEALVHKFEGKAVAGNILHALGYQSCLMPSCPHDHYRWRRCLQVSILVRQWLLHPTNLTASRVNQPHDSKFTLGASDLLMVPHALCMELAFA